MEKYSFRQGFSLPLSYHPKIPFYLLPLYKQQLLAGPLLHLLAFTMNKEVFRTCIHNRMMQAGQGIFPPCKAKNRSNTWCIARFFPGAKSRLRRLRLDAPAGAVTQRDEKIPVKAACREILNRLLGRWSQNAPTSSAYGARRAVLGRKRLPLTPAAVCASPSVGRKPAIAPILTQKQLFRTAA